MQQRYYKEKHGFDEKDVEKVKDVCINYLKGMAWTLQYYLHGCTSWSWYYPYYYAPLLSSFELLENLDINLSVLDDSKPIPPLEQLMSVLPPQSSHLLPQNMAELMKKGSPLEKYYPTTFSIDMMGGHQPWKGITFIPIIDGEFLEKTLKDSKIILTDEEEKRNKTGFVKVFVQNKDECLCDGSLIWGELKKTEIENCFHFIFENPPREKNLSYIPLNIDLPRNIVGGVCVGPSKPEDMPLSIPGIPYNCKRDFRITKIIQEKTRKSTLSVNKKKKNLSHLI